MTKKGLVFVPALFIDFQKYIRAKTHRPLLFTSGSYNYKLSKYLASLLAPFYSNDNYVSRDSFEFIREVVNTKNCKYVMASYDVEALFTNVQVQETVDIISESCFPFADSIFHDYDRKVYKKYLICVQRTLSSFSTNLHINRSMVS